MAEEQGIYEGGDQAYYMLQEEGIRLASSQKKPNDFSALYDAMYQAVTQGHVKTINEMKARFHGYFNENQTGYAQVLDYQAPYRPHAGNLKQTNMISKEQMIVILLTEPLRASIQSLTEKGNWNLGTANSISELLNYTNCVKTGNLKAVHPNQARSQDLFSAELLVYKLLCNRTQENYTQLIHHAQLLSGRSERKMMLVGALIMAIGIATMISIMPALMAGSSISFYTAILVISGISALYSGAHMVASGRTQGLSAHLSAAGNSLWKARNTTLEAFKQEPSKSSTNSSMMLGLSAVAHNIVGTLKFW